MARTMEWTLADGLRDRHRQAQLASDRRAGAHSRREVRRLQREWAQKFWMIIVGTLVAAGVAAALIHRFIDTPFAPYATGALLASACWFLYVQLLLTGNVANHLTGILGEEWTTDELRKTRRDGWMFVNHVMLEHSDVDHVLLGPGGFFAVETKFRSDWSSREWEFDRIAGQARQAARATWARIDLKLMRVKPLVVMWGPGMRSQFPEPFEHDGVVFCPGHRLFEYVESQPVVMEKAEVTAAFDQLGRYVDTRQLGEIRAYGEIPRSVSQTTNDLAMVFGAFLATLLIVVTPATVSPEGVWSATAAAALTALSLLARRNWPRSPRVQRLTTAVITTSVAAGVVMATAAAWLHLVS
jgi:hypothetical protein